MTYKRVIPRDLFNEANLLKCLGHLYLLTENMRNVSFTFVDDSSFNIQQNQHDGSIFSPNIGLMINSDFYTHYRPLNSREPWPLYLYDSVSDDTWPVFTDEGELSSELKDLIYPERTS